jgi:hypothetical protein
VAAAAIPIAIGLAGGLASTVIGEALKPSAPDAPDPGPAPGPVPDASSLDQEEIRKRLRATRDLSSLRIDPAQNTTGLQIPPP